MNTHLLTSMSPRRRLALGGAALLALGVAGGAGAVSLTRPTVEMAPTVQTAVAKLPATNGVVTVRGRVAAVYGDRFLVQDATGRTLVDAGRNAAGLATGSAILVQGRYGDGQLHARYLVDSSGAIEEVGPRGPHGPRPGAGAPPPPPSGGPGAPPPPPPGGPGAPPPSGAGAPPPPPVGAVLPPPGGPGGQLPSRAGQVAPMPGQTPPPAKEAAPAA